MGSTIVHQGDAFQLFGEPPKEFSSPMGEKDHPELDLSPELDLGLPVTH
jgi:hypothetical protein